MSQRDDPPLQSLRIPAGWTVVQNAFFEIDPADADDNRRLVCFGEDMLQISGGLNPVVVDLGWSPAGDVNGRYRLVAVGQYADMDEMVASWDRPLRILTSRSRMEVVRAIEGWLQELSR